MRRVLPFLFLLALALPAAAGAAERVSIERVGLDLAAIDVARLRTLGFDVTEEVTRDHADVVAYSDAERARLRALGFPVTTRVPDVLTARAAATRANRRALRAQGGSGLPSGRQDYRHLDDYSHELDALVAGHPGLVRRVVLPGKSVEGREISGVEIASNVGAADDGGRPVYMVMGLHHAREWPSGEVAMEFALDLVQHYGHDARITKLLDHLRVYVLPVINPDGFQISREAVDVNSLRRKNCAATVDVPCATSTTRGVDLNRNYGAYWGGNGAATDHSDETYRGPGPWSEPEAQAVHQLTRGLQVTGLQTLHNYAALVLRPPGFKALGLAPDEPRLKALGDAMAAAAGYTSQYGYELYEVTGATEDWNYVAQGTFGYTIELGGNSFQDPYAQGVVDQYLGTPGTASAGKGVREALLLAGGQAMDVQDHAVLTGAARPGLVLRLRKAFKTSTSPVCQSFNPLTSECAVAGAPILLEDGLDTTTVVPASGRFAWHVNPSTRPFEGKAGHVEAWTFSCEATDGRVLATQRVVAARGQSVALSKPCGAEGAPAPASLRVRLSLARAHGSGVLPRAARRVRARCSTACTVSVRVTLRGALVARGSRRLPANRLTAVAVRSTRPGRARLARVRHGRLVVRAVARSADGTRAVAQTRASF